jgi:hypothetical protein
MPDYYKSKSVGFVRTVELGLYVRRSETTRHSAMLSIGQLTEARHADRHTRIKLMNICVGTMASFNRRYQEDVQSSPRPCHVAGACPCALPARFSGK